MCESKPSFQSMRAIGFIAGHHLFAERKENTSSLPPDCSGKVTLTLENSIPKLNEIQQSLKLLRTDIKNTGIVPVKAYAMT